MSGRRRQTTTPAPAGRQDPKRIKRPEVLPSSSGAEKEKGSSSTAAPAMGSSSSAPATGSSSSAPAMVQDLAVEEQLLQCIICFFPLKPPIFQCGVGHVLCSPCSEKLKDARKCHLCGAAMATGYQRCHAMEDVMSSIRGPCPHAPYGCDARPVYHAREEHVLECPHAPCHCPGAGCSFVGTAATLIEHIAAAPHSWPCTAEVRTGCAFDVDLRVGFNFLTAVRGSAKHLLLLNMASTPFGNAVSAVWIRSLANTMASSRSSAPPAPRKTTCNLKIHYKRCNAVGAEHCQRSDETTSQFDVECRCPSNGLPDPNASFQLFMPKYVIFGGVNDTVRISATISIRSS